VGPDVTKTLSIEALKELNAPFIAGDGVVDEEGGYDPDPGTEALKSKKPCRVTDRERWHREWARPVPLLLRVHGHQKQRRFVC
jgi:hypothetical protein